MALCLPPVEGKAPDCNGRRQISLAWNMPQKYPGWWAQMTLVVASFILTLISTTVRNCLWAHRYKFDIVYLMLSSGEAINWGECFKGFLLFIFISCKCNSDVLKTLVRERQLQNVFFLLYLSRNNMVTAPGVPFLQNISVRPLIWIMFPVSTSLAPFVTSKTRKLLRTRAGRPSCVAHEVLQHAPICHDSWLFCWRAITRQPLYRVFGYLELTRATSSLPKVKIKPDSVGCLLCSVCPIAIKDLPGILQLNTVSVIGWP